MRRRSRRGATMVEFVLAGIPMLFAWISIVEMARGMWYYHTLQYSVKRAASYLTVHGATCAMAPNSCTIQIKDVAAVLRSTAIGISDSNMNVTFTSQSGTSVSCAPLSNCSANTTQWPPTTNGDNQVGKFVQIRADIMFHSALSMWVPGQGGVQFGVFDFPGFAQEMIRF
ncbi:MAG: pilus assembly protein [Acidobacteria bacterium]|nr:pilus assembly protein [Acidobacteriota bacterium]